MRVRPVGYQKKMRKMESKCDRDYGCADHRSIFVYTIAYLIGQNFRWTKLPKFQEVPKILSAEKFCLPKFWSIVIFDICL